VTRPAPSCCTLPLVLRPAHSCRALPTRAALPLVLRPDGEIVYEPTHPLTHSHSHSCSTGCSRGIRIHTSTRPAHSCCTLPTRAAPSHSCRALLDQLCMSPHIHSPTRTLTRARLAVVKVYESTHPRALPIRDAPCPLVLHPTGSIVYEPTHPLTHPLAPSLVLRPAGSIVYEPTHPLAPTRTLTRARLAVVEMYKPTSTHTHSHSYSCSTGCCRGVQTHIHPQPLTPTRTRARLAGPEHSNAYHCTILLDAK
jgi:hypothetical protein